MECKLDDKHAVEIVYKCLYLRQAYQIALEKIATPQTTWEDCCREAIKKLANVGIRRITSGRTIQDWNLTFRINEIFPHPSIRVELTYQHKQQTKADQLKKARSEKTQQQIHMSIK